MQDAKQPASTIEALIYKATLKQDVYQDTLNTFQLFKKVIKELVDTNKTLVRNANPTIILDYEDPGAFEITLKFGGDYLIFLMHTNIFEFPRDHEVMKTAYIKEDPSRSYCGMITIYNFLADSFNYHRESDIGYMIGRIFVNKDLHYFIEGKREIGMLYNNFQSAEINADTVKQLVESAMTYTLNFDLLTPPYDNMKEVSVAEMQATLENLPMATGKRLGYRFTADTDTGK
ncbi:MAG: hypothetical protein WCO63_14455 [Bacteroidota bacterium]